MVDYLGKKIKFNIEDNDLQKIRFNKAYGESQQGASPSPDYPSPIENVEGKNKFDINQEKEIFGIMLYKYSYYLKPNTKYTISSNCPASTTANIYANSNSSNSAVYINKNQTIQSDKNGYFYILVRFKADASDNSTFNLYEKVLNGTYYIQLEEGTVATPYVPYNSLEFKDEGKNKFNVQDTNNVTEGITVDNEGWITVTGDNTDGTATKYFNYFTNNLALTTVTNYNVIAEVKIVNGTGIVHFSSNGSTSKQFETRFYRDFTNLANNKVYKLICKTADEFVGNNGLRTFVEFSAGQSGSITFRLSVLEDTTITAENFEYEEYKSQVATFPLAEGQKLYKGSYLADDGIHHSRKQVVFDGSDDETWTQNGSKQGYGIEISDVGGGDSHTVNKVLCDKLTPVTQAQIFTGVVENAVASIGGTAHKLYVRFDSSITTVALLREKLAESPILIEYELAEEEIVPYTETQQEAREKLRHFKGLNGENNITAQGTMTSTLDLTLYNVAEEDFDIYISKKGYFRALKYDINNLIDFMESNIPSIAEATESSVKIAGRDGDISLNTVYEPLPFEIVCYTEDNLTPEEKIIEEQKITSLLNSIKNQTKTFFMEREKKFYKVKYSGNLSVVRYPKHLKFTIPLKSSESYAMNYEESEIIGNGTKVSNTIKDTGAIFTIKGPATKPIISLNNYQMKYNENILEGNSLIINSEDSTITHITSAGVKTNAMRAYNHEFPKIKNGENQLAVSSGIDDEKQVNVKWYDLKI